MKIVIILFLIVLSCHSCRRNIEAGIKTTVSGQVFDFNKQQPIPNVPILVVEYENGLYGPRPKAVIDSTSSGSDGRYSLTFTTTGKGTQYRIGFRPSIKFYTIQDAVTIITGKDTTVNFWATELHTLKAEIHMVNNPNPPMRVGTIAGLGAVINGTDKDTTILLQIFPNIANEIQFNITNIDTPSLYNIRLDTIMLQGFPDTFTWTFQVDPRFFPIRR